MKHNKCEICGKMKDDVVEIPFQNGLSHKLCMKCAGQIAVETTRLIDLGVKQ